MSHIVTIETQIKDVEALRNACRRLNLAAPVWQTVKLFSGKTTGHAVQLPDWRYPIICDTEAGKIEFDNFEGRWGDRKELDRLLQAYSVEKAAIETRRQGHSLCEQPLPDGSIKLTIQVGGAA